MSTSLTFSQALDQAELLARQALPDALHERLSCAVALVKAGAVFQDDAGHWTVASASTPDQRYTVNGSCSCQDAFYQAPQGRCKHKLAQYLARKTQALLHGAVGTEDGVGTPGTTPAPETLKKIESTPLPEAPASCNVYVVISGHKVQVTLRDGDEQRMLARLQTLLDTYPTPQPAPPAPPQGQLSPQQHNAAAMHQRVTDFCKIHSVPMQLNQKDGRSWYSHRTDQGWCKGK